MGNDYKPKLETAKLDVRKLSLYEADDLCRKLREVNPNSCAFNVVKNYVIYLDCIKPFSPDSGLADFIITVNEEELGSMFGLLAHAFVDYDGWYSQPAFDIPGHLHVEGGIVA